MTDTTPRLRLPELAAAQAQKHVTVNEALIKLDALTDLYLTGMTLASPPSSPADGIAYLVAAGGSGAWNGQDGKIAYCIDGSWRFYAPFGGLRAFNAADGKFYVYSGGGWTGWSANQIGVTDGSNAAAGAVGEYVSSIVSVSGAVTLTSGANANVTGIGLAAGDWDVDGLVEYNAAAATVAANSAVYSGIATASATLTDTQYAAQRAEAISAASFSPWLALAAPRLRLSFSSAATAYLVAQASFTAGAVKAYGVIRARRVR
jgi:hypothetical protein